MKKLMIKESTQTVKHFKKSADDLKGYNIIKKGNIFRITDDNDVELDIDFESEDSAKEYINTIDEKDFDESKSIKESYSGLYTERMFEYMDICDRQDLYNLCISFIKWMGDDELGQFARANDITTVFEESKQPTTGKLTIKEGYHNYHYTVYYIDNTGTHFDFGTDAENENAAIQDLYSKRGKDKVSKIVSVDDNWYDPRLRRYLRRTNPRVVKEAPSHKLLIVEEPTDVPKLPRIKFKGFKEDGIRDESVNVKWWLEQADSDPMYTVSRVITPTPGELKRILSDNPELLNTYIKKFKNHCKRFLSTYQFNKDRALNNIQYEILDRADQYVTISPNAEDLDRGELRKLTRSAMSEYVKQVGVDKGYETLFNCWNTPSNSPIVVEEYKYVRPEDIGKPEHSEVHNSSFSTYYYYNVTFKFGEESVTFLHTESTYYSGGWN